MGNSGHCCFTLKEVRAAASTLLKKFEKLYWFFGKIAGKLRSVMPSNIALTHFSTLKLSGAKTQEFLQGQLTCDMRLISNHGDYSFAACCDHRGRMIANFWIIRWHDDYLILLPKNLSQTLSDHLKKYAVFSKVEITEQTDFLIAEAEAIKNYNDQSIMITLPNPARHILLSTQKINDSVDAHEEWKRRNIHDQLCILCDKTSLLFTPQMINMEKLGGVSFTKGCYVGQEIVARTEYLGKLKRHLHRLQLHSNHILNPGDEIENGVITEAVEIEQHYFDVLVVMQDQKPS